MFKTCTFGIGSETVPNASQTTYINLIANTLRKHMIPSTASKRPLQRCLTCVLLRRRAQFLKEGNKKENKSSYVTDTVGDEAGLTFIYHKNEPTKSVEATCGVYGARRARPAANTLPFSSLHFPFLLSIHFQNRERHETWV